LDFLGRVIVGLEQEGWFCRVDTGWCRYDVEVLGNRWARIQITTVSEYYAKGQKLFRCRLRGLWSLPAKLFFWSAVGLELLLIGLFVDEQPWFWMSLLSLPMLAWFLEQEKQTLQRLMSAFLDQAAKELGLVKVRFDPAEDQFTPISDKQS
jgi:hypothetical protein